MLDENSPPRVSVIIPNRDGKAYLETCFKALRAQVLKPYEIIMVEDGSQDGSAEYVRENFPEVKVVPSSDRGLPQGFAGGVNVGIRASTGDYIALLNNDTEVYPEWLSAALEVLSRHPQSASCACRMYLKDGKHINAVGLMPEKSGECRTIADGCADGSAFEVEREIFGPSGGAAVWRRSVLDEIGLFDTDYFAYYEDADLAFRARAAGYSCVYAPQSRLIHLEGRCPSLKRFDKVALRLRNGFWFAWSNFPASTILKNFPAILWGTFFHRLFKYGPRLWKVEGRSFWKSAWWIFTSLPKVLRKRRARRKACKVSAAELEKWLGFDPFTGEPPEA